MRSNRQRYQRLLAPSLVLTASLLTPSFAEAGAQKFTPLSASVRTVLQHSISDQAAPKLVFESEQDGELWLKEMSQRMRKLIPDDEIRKDFLISVQYEATRAGLDPQLVLGLIEVESRFRKYAVSRAGARGYMQVMPFWVKQIGSKGQNLFHLRTNLRFGCTILRHYLDIEKGDLDRALGRYNGSLGKMAYPRRVKRAWHKHWRLPRALARSDSDYSS